MKTIRKELNMEHEVLKAVSKYLGDDNYAIFDIETTGLSPNFSSVILSGFVLVRNGEATLLQYFAETPLDEQMVLQETADLISSLSYIVTYNGRFFDIPFIIKRCQKYGIPVNPPFDMDLFVLMKHYSPIGKLLPSLSQKSLEDYSNISNLRTDRISGGESLELYDMYQKVPSNDILDKILLHNSDDVMQLFRLLPLLKNCDVDRAFNKSGFPVHGGMLTSISLKGCDLTIEGRLDSPCEYIGFPSSDNPLHVQAHKSDSSLEINAACEKKDDAVYFDLLPFVSLSQENSHLESLLDEIRKCSGYVNNYLILKEGKDIKYDELNKLARFLSTKTIIEII